MLYDLGVKDVYHTKMMSQKRKFENAFDESNSELFECKYCSFKTNNIDVLDEHIQMHEDTLTIAEEEEKMKIIEEEIEVKKKEVKFEIDQYEKKKKVISKNDKSTSDEVWFKCGLCTYKTRRKHDLPKHFLTHCSLKTTTVYRCSECNYETKRKNDMPKHMLGHCNDGG